MTFLTVTAPIVLDASVAVAIVTGEHDAPANLQRWGGDRRLLLAPPLLYVETANALVRGKRLSPADVSSLLTTLRGAGIDIADRGAVGLEAAVVLADRHSLTVYDATYLWLAMDVDGELATFDRALIGAAEAEGVELAIPA
jgi:predicted nucleic acid-binding protein